MKQEKSQYFPDPNGKNTAENETLHFLNGLTPKKCVFLNTLYAFVLNVKKNSIEDDKKHADVRNKEVLQILGYVTQYCALFLLRHISTLTLICGTSNR